MTVATKNHFETHDLIVIKLKALEHLGLSAPLCGQLWETSQVSAPIPVVQSPGIEKVDPAEHSVWP